MVLARSSDQSSTHSRRAVFRSTASGFGHLAFLNLFADIASANASGTSGNPLLPQAPHFVPRAKRVIFLFMHGGVSHIDTFDPKPKLTELNGKPLPFDTPLQFNEVGNLLQSPWRFRRYGQSGLPVSELFPHVSGVVDELSFVKSMHVEQVDHGGAILQLLTGSAVFTRPSLGAWVTYGLGSDNQDMPGFVSMSTPVIHGATQLFGSAFLPASFQGTAIGNANVPLKKANINNLNPALGSTDVQRLQIDLIQAGNRDFGDGDSDSRLNARIEAMELAFRMQMAAPEVLSISQESQQTLDLYGVDQGPTDNFGRQCLLARRMVEKGVRFVQCSHTYKWDQHSDLKNGHEGNAREVDKPIAALIQDLKHRGLLDETLVVWGTEFGRTPVAEGTDGRDHNPYGFTMWMAGGGVKQGYSHGNTDEFGYFAMENKTSMYDLHATILHLLGMDHTALTYRYAGRDFRLTDVFGKVVDEIIS